MSKLIKKLLRENLFKDFEVEDHGKIVDTEYTTEKIVLPLYRGLRNLFDNNAEHPELVPHNNGYVLVADKFPDKLIWFSDNPDFAEKYNGWGLITYKLPAIKHHKIVTYEDGHKRDTLITTDDVVESGYGRGRISADPYKSNHFHRGIELPDHWFWSYKTEKHIVCDTNLYIDDTNVTVNKKG